MEHRIIKKGERTWIIEEGDIRMFLLEGDEKALLIDTGLTVEDVRGIAQSLTSRTLFLLNTHADRDHIGCNEQFESFFMHPAEIPNFERSGKKGTVIPVEEGDVIDLGNRELRIIHIPGHTPGSIGVLDVGNRILISGDPVQQNGAVFMFGAQRSMEDYIKGLEHLEGYTDEFDELWPSHGDLPVAPSVIPVLRRGAEDVLAGKIKGVPREVHGNSIMAYDAGPATLLCDE
jgi:glyoxylase-like metal-dependent hydrolase (beta-lactamase superfamily II)